MPLADFKSLKSRVGCTVNDAVLAVVAEALHRFLVDRGMPGFDVRPGYHSVSYRGYHNNILAFDECRVPASQVLGEEGQGFEIANTWLRATRLTVAACRWMLTPTQSSPAQAWLGFAGGYWVRSPACVPVLVRAGGQTRQVHIGIGAPCPGPRPRRGPRTPP